MSVYFGRVRVQYIRISAGCVAVVGRSPQGAWKEGTKEGGNEGTREGAKKGTKGGRKEQRRGEPQRDVAGNGVELSPCWGMLGMHHSFPERR